MSKLDPFAQMEYDVRVAWGEAGLHRLAPVCDVIVIVDVLSFTTSVDIAVGRGATVFPYRGSADGVDAYAAAVDAQVAHKARSAGRISLAPSSLLTLPPGVRLVLPSLNGSTLSLGAGATPVLAGCLRNAGVVATAAERIGGTVGVIAAGERWWHDGTLRPCFEDFIGAGAIVSALTGTKSPEAHAAEAAFAASADRLPQLLAECGSGQELIGQGFAADVALAAALNVSECAPRLRDRAFRAL